MKRLSPRNSRSKRPSSLKRHTVLAFHEAARRGQPYKADEVSPEEPPRGVDGARREQEARSVRLKIAPAAPTPAELRVKSRD
jgi:hypothetical protein